MKKNLFIAALLMVSSSAFAEMRGGSLSERMTSALGQKNRESAEVAIVSESGDCVLSVDEADPSRHAIYVTLSKGNERPVSFMGLDQDLTESIVEATFVSATTKYSDGYGHLVTRKLVVTEMPPTGLKGATVTITDNVATKSCRF